ncbi:AraC family transcriptional regulator [Pseudomonas extremaustralis]|uniref:AraC family transcriptional regulator n=1 Tax=Pseudomonas extremaustralis TaxID=359110 RepID=UPI0021C6F086|nr:AraC family transcriptional regulator [Pseudomonas extremaustralis]UUJ40891.1 AraC family transcriptional regulator [Pseudomonas extremaustralis]
MSGVVRSACLAHYADVALSVGLDPLAQLRAVSLDPQCLEDADLRIPVEAVARLLENSARDSGAEDLGLRLAERRQVFNLGPLALMVRSGRTLRHVLEVLRNYLSLHNEGLLLQIEEGSALVVLRVAQVTSGLLPIRQVTELSLAVTHLMLKGLLGKHWQPVSICFTHAPPRTSDRHLRLFGDRVKFNSSLDGIVFQSQQLDAELSNADPMMARYAQLYLEHLRTELAITFAEKVRQMIWVLLPSGMCNADQVASDLNLVRRTLDRRLAREGESFVSLRDQVRRELAFRYLANPSLALSEIASALGFSELSAFSRWFSQRFGCSPSTWRAGRHPSAR